MCYTCNMELGKVDIIPSSDSGILFDEFEIITETEPNESSKKKSDTERYHYDIISILVSINYMYNYYRLEEYLSYTRSDKYKEVSDSSLADLKNSVEEDKTFSHFQKRVSLEPEQVIVTSSKKNTLV